MGGRIAAGDAENDPACSLAHPLGSKKYADR